MVRIQSSSVLSLTHSGRGTRHVRSPKTKGTKAIPASVNLSATVQGAIALHRLIGHKTHGNEK